MSLTIPTSTRHYAVISVRTDPHREQSVIAYTDEKSLRGLIAAPSIVAMGFRSRAEAVAYMGGRCSTGQASSPESTTELSGTAALYLSESAKIHRTYKVKLDPPNMWAKICHLMRYSFAVAVVLIYSRNFISATFRAVISF